MTYERRGPVMYLYVVGASSSPNYVTCSVPREVDSKEIFFGPCKKRLREHVKIYVLGELDEVEPNYDIYVVGFNALPSPNGPRKVIWAGRINRVMTFARATELFVGPRYANMYKCSDSPLNVQPVRISGKLAGYEFRPNGIHVNSWKDDLTGSMQGVKWDGNQLLLQPGVKPTDGFNRDAVFTLDNLFFAKGEGLAVDGALVEILRETQNGRSDIDEVAIFGRSANGQPDGKRGNYLTIAARPDLVAKMLDWIRRGAEKALNDNASHTPYDESSGSPSCGRTRQAQAARAIRLSGQRSSRKCH
jgi:hypothetical protein